MTGPLLSVRNLIVHFYTYEGVVKALDGVSLDIDQGETVGLVGETGCGKSVTALSILRLIDRPGRIVSGEIWFDGVNILELSEQEIRQIRGKTLSAIFQDPTTYLNPVYTIGDQVAESIRQHQEVKLLVNATGKSPKSTVGEKVIKSLEKVKMPEPENVAKSYPHELSTGMRQRALIAMMAVASPRLKLLIADEPTTALDVTIQAQILKLMDDLKQDLGMSMLLITHDLGLVAKMCDKVALMYAGNIVEQATVDEMFYQPKHPYFKGILNAIPRSDHPVDALEVIPGLVPNLITPPSGCRFHPRCPYVMPVCKEMKPGLLPIEREHYVACHLYRSETQT